MHQELKKYLKKAPFKKGRFFYTIKLMIFLAPEIQTVQSQQIIEKGGIKKGKYKWNFSISRSALESIIKCGIIKQVN